MSTLTMSLDARSIVDTEALVYTAAFDRAPDQAGLDFWAGQIAGGNVTEHSFANMLAASPEFTTAHAGETGAQIIDDIYMNVLHRHADAAGTAFWLSHGSIGDAILGISTSNEAVADNDLGVHRFEDAAATGTVDGVHQLDNTPTPPPAPVTVYVDDPYPVYVNVPSPTFHSSASLAGTPYANATGGLTFGDGTTPAIGMVTAEDANNLFAGMSERPRQSNGLVYSPSDTVNSGNSIIATFTTAAGAQSTASGSFADSPTHSSIAEAFVIGSGTMTFAQAYAAGYTAHLQIDNDPTAAVNYAGTTYTGAVQADGTLQWVNTTAGAGDITDNGGNTHVAANSTLVSFLPGGLANAADGNTFTNHIDWTNSAGVEVTGVTTVNHLSATASDWSPLHT